MPISSVISIAPVFSIVSAVPGTSGAAGAAAVAAGGAAGGTADVLLFRRALYTDGDRGTLVGYSSPVRMTGSVARKGLPTMHGEGKAGELRRLMQLHFDITTDSDPSAALGARLKTDDLVGWAGLDLSVVGTAVPQGSGWLTRATLTI